MASDQLPTSGDNGGNRQYASPGRVARALGVSETTVKRWVDEGRLPAHRTAGGHRKILVSDVVELAARENWPQLDLTSLTGQAPAPVVAAQDTAGLHQQFTEALLAEDGVAVRRLILDAHQAGWSVPRLADEIISPVMAGVGHGWSAGQLDVFQEHRSTQICLGALRALQARLERPSHEAGGALAVGGGPESDHYTLANLLIELALLDQGWRVVNIGPNTPFASFRRAMRERRPRLLWISCSYLPNAEVFLAGYTPLYEEAVELGVAVSVGGRALTEDVRNRMTFTHTGTRLGHLVAFANQLAAPRRN